MEITFKQVDDIVRTLPIGLYAKRRIPMETSAEAETSYYTPSLDTITISYPIIATAVKSLPDMDMNSLESAVRSMVYHEVGHGMLTPQTMKINDIINIFEDERLERILDNTFLDVDFKKQVYAINGYTEGEELPTPDTDIAKFYHLVRFRSHPNPDLVNMVDKIINAYRHLNYYSPYHTHWRYRDSIQKLFALCIQSTFQKEELQQIEVHFPAEAVGKSAEGEKKNEFLYAVNIMRDEKLYQSLSIIFESFNKKNSKGNAIQGYSGILNPRFADRPDYRMFDRATATRGNNTFGTFHLNLFIDISGSMSRNELQLNQLIRTLISLEEKNPNFDFTIITCERGQKILTNKKDYTINCNGGNELTTQIFSQYRQVQKPNTYNYNIVLFDGDAFPTHRTNFKAFDFNNCTIISDRENAYYINPHVKTARVIYTSDYTAELFDNIIKVMQTAFR